MRLVDCFIELIAYTSYLVNNLSSGHTSYEQVKTDITHLLEKSQDNFRECSISQEDFDLARFAVLAWIDETILSSDWKDKKSWQGEQLQRTYYQTTDAGELFFDKLNTLEPRQRQVREVYYICLALGFAGRYCNPGDEFLLKQLTMSNLKLLGGSPDTPKLESQRLFPGAYIGNKSSTVTPGNRRRFSSGLLLGMTLPIILFAALFFIYRFVLHNVGTNFLTSIQ